MHLRNSASQSLTQFSRLCPFQRSRGIALHTTLKIIDSLLAGPFLRPVYYCGSCRAVERIGNIEKYLYFNIGGNHTLAMYGHHFRQIFSDNNPIALYLFTASIIEGET